MLSINKIKFYLVISIIGFMAMGLLYENTKLELDKTKQELNRCKTDMGYIPSGDIEKDSLKMELFNSQNINGRYELTLEYLKEVNPSAAKQFENYLSKETE